MIALFLAVSISAVPAAAAPVESEEAQASQRVAERVVEILDGILGPGRAKVQVEIHGGSSQIRTESEFTSPTDSGAPPPVETPVDTSPRYLDLPGYTKGLPMAQINPPSVKSKANTAAAAAPTAIQRDHEQSMRESGFEVRQILATVVLDSALGDAPVRDVSQLLPQLLRIDNARGDVLTILRAPMRPAWKSAFATPADWRAASYVAAAVLAALIAALIAGSSFVRGARALGAELASRRGGQDAPPDEGESAEPLPELVAGGPPGGLLDDGSQAGAAAPLLLGQRFDFLMSREPAVISRALSGESTETLCLLFGHLATASPDLASRLFGNLPPTAQAEVSQSLVKLSVADPERLDEIEAKLRKSIENGVEGPQSLGKILSRVPGEARADILALLSAKDARAGEEVLKHVFSFEDLEGLSVADLRRLLTSVPYETWGVALRGAPQTIIDRVLADLPEGPRQSVRDESQVPQSKEKVTAARSKILDTFFEMSAKGTIGADRAKADGDLV